MLRVQGSGLRVQGLWFRIQSTLTPTPESRGEGGGCGRQGWKVRGNIDAPEVAGERRLHVCDLARRHFARSFEGVRTLCEKNRLTL